MGVGGGAVIQAPRKSNGIELSYSQHTGIHEEPQTELARLHAQLRQVREWADRGEWRESGSDGLYAILSDVAVSLTDSGVHATDAGAPEPVTGVRRR
jgi:hypothetical protein